MSVVVSAPLGYFLTWTTYGTWLPGDERGWVDGTTHEVCAPAPERERQARQLLAEEPITLTIAQRALVTATIGDHCRIRGWTLHAVNVRSNHAHVVVTFPVHPDKAMGEFKSWATRRLKEAHPGRLHWWTERGSKRYLWTEEDLTAAITYVLELQ
jgi:REP element-mobilizing transposase RayT